MTHKFRVVLVDYDADQFDLTSEVNAKMEQTLAEIGAVLDVGQHRIEEAVFQAAGQADLVMMQSVRPLHC